MVIICNASFLNIFHNLKIAIITIIIQHTQIIYQLTNLMIISDLSKYAIYALAYGHHVVMSNNIFIYHFYYLFLCYFCYNHY